MFTKKAQAEDMCSVILKSINNESADMVVTPCGLCQINLDTAKNLSSHFNGKKLSIPVLTITQLIGIALGIKNSELGITKNELQSKQKVSAVLE